jgi:hypothetical protein
MESTQKRLGDTMGNFLKLIIFAVLVFPQIVSASTMTSAEEQVQTMYIAYYGRPADPDGLAYWAERIAGDGSSMDAIIDSFGNSDEYREHFAGLSSIELVSNIYAQFLGRAPDTEGLTFYKDKLDNGEMTLASIALNVANGVFSGTQDYNVIYNRLAVANEFTSSIRAHNVRYTSGNAVDAKKILSLVDGTAVSRLEGYQHVLSFMSQGYFSDPKPEPEPGPAYELITFSGKAIESSHEYTDPCSENYEDRYTSKASFPDRTALFSGTARVDWERGIIDEFRTTISFDSGDVEVHDMANRNIDATSVQNVSEYTQRWADRTRQGRLGAEEKSFSTARYQKRSDGTIDSVPGPNWIMNLVLERATNPGAFNISETDTLYCEDRTYGERSSRYLRGQIESLNID